MTSALLLARDRIVYSVNVWLVPVECAFNMIESELVRRGVQLYPDANGHSACPFMIDPGSGNDWHDMRGHLEAKLAHLQPQPWAERRKQDMPSTSGRTADERSRIVPKGLPRGSRAL